MPARVLGIDAGGSSTRALMVDGDRVVHEGIGGPANPNGTSEEVVRSSLLTALDGCPQPEQIGVGLAGGARSEARTFVADVLADRFPGAEAHITSDVVPAFHACAPGTGAVVIAGTGSIVASPVDGGFAVSGGLGWMVGDDGSASRLGQRLMRWYCAAGADERASIEPLVRAALGEADPSSLAARIARAEAPARELARAAPVLTAAARQGMPWASRILCEEMAHLARTCAAHLTQHGVRPAVGLVGGVWQAGIATEAFSTALRELVPAASVGLAPDEPVVGAIRWTAGA